MGCRSPPRAGRRAGRSTRRAGHAAAPMRRRERPRRRSTGRPRPRGRRPRGRRRAAPEPGRRPRTTWWLVSRNPSGVNRNPEPEPPTRRPPPPEPGADGPQVHDRRTKQLGHRDNHSRIRIESFSVRRWHVGRVRRGVRRVGPIVDQPKHVSASSRSTFQKTGAYPETFGAGLPTPPKRPTEGLHTLARRLALRTRPYCSPARQAGRQSGRHLARRRTIQAKWSIAAMACAEVRHDRRPSPTRPGKDAS